MGRLTDGHYVRRGNCGFPGGYLMIWQGRTTPGTPWEFLNWPEVFGATRRRLELRGLALRAIALDAKREGRTVTVHVLVSRVPRDRAMPMEEDFRVEEYESEEAND